MTTPGRALLALALAGATAGCAPSLQHLVEARRYADAICLASSAEEAAAVAAAVERDAAPAVSLYPVHASELAPVLGEEAARRTLGDALLLRAKTARASLSVSSLEFDVVLRKQRKEEKEDRYEPLYALRQSSDDWRTLFRLTGEPPPASARFVTEIDGQALGAAIFTLGLSRLFSSKPITRVVERHATTAEWQAAGPRAAAIERALAGGDGVEGYVIREEKDHEIHTGLRLAVTDHLNDGGSCELTIWYELALPPLRPAAAPALDWVFGERMRPLPELPVRERSYLLSNPFGYWSSHSPGGGG